MGVPEREFVRGATGLVKSFFRPFGAGAAGLKPRILFGSNAALKRRSSTVLLAFGGAFYLAPQGLKPIS
jgi:hypothetical protein